MKQHFIYSSLACLIIATSAHALPNTQAGDILVGAPFKLNASNSPASYYADGTSGQIEFACKISGDGDVHVTLTPGKNFDNYYNAHFIPLTAGETVRQLWTLTDEKENNGNIKIAYGSGENVVVECKGIKR